MAALKLVRPLYGVANRPEEKVFGGALGGLFMRHLGQRRAIANTFAALVSLWQRKQAHIVRRAICALVCALAATGTAPVGRAA